MRADPAITQFTRPLLAWYRAHGRHDLPWRKTRDPYTVLVSELMLQQTQVPRVVPKYLAFLEKFPSVEALARAPRADVLRAWQGLGYNSRAARLHALAGIIAARGEFPRDEQELRLLPGVGPYTAGAVMIFAHDLPAHSVDVNVRRTVTRITTSPRSAPKDIEKHAYAWLAAGPHDVQSALMDLGSSICTAKTPQCDRCPMRACCASKGPHPSEHASRKTHVPFKGSVRWHRGVILRELLAQATGCADLRRRVLQAGGTLEAFDAALEGLERESTVSRQGQRLSIR